MTKTKIAVTAFVVTFALSAAGPSWASKSVTSGDDAPARNPNVLKIATGPSGKGYSKLFADLKTVCSEQVQMQEVKTAGGLDNLNVLSNKKADVALAQLDTIKDLSPSDESVAALKAVTVMNYNYLHVLTSGTGYAYDQGREWYGAKKSANVVRITKFSDLKGKTVALVGSAQIMAVALTQRQLKDYNMRFVNVASDAEAAKMVQAGTAQAMMTVAGAPHGFVSGLTATSNLTLVPFDEDLGGVYVVRKIKYPNLNVFGMKILAVPNVLVARDFGGKKADQVGALFQCLSSNLQELKDGEYEPAWGEVRMDAAVDLPKFRK